MGSQFNSIGRRPKERVTVRKGALAFNGSRCGQIVSCSMTDLRFRYRGERIPVVLRQGDAATDNLDIVFSAHEFYLTDLPVASVADYPMTTLSAHPKSAIMRLRHLTFGPLSAKQRTRLEHFLQLNRFGLPTHELGPETDLAAGGTDQS